MFLKDVLWWRFSVKKIGCGAAALCLTEVWSDHREA